jgi:hypothetical protein
MVQSGSKHPWEQRVSEAGARLRDEIVDELQRFVRTIDTEVVPEVRRNSSSALKAAATHLQKLAERMDDRTPPTQPSDDEKPQ